MSPQPPPEPPVFENPLTTPLLMLTTLITLHVAVSGDLAPLLILAGIPIAFALNKCIPTRSPQ